MTVHHINTRKPKTDFELANKLRKELIEHLRTLPEQPEPLASRAKTIALSAWHRITRRVPQTADSA